MPILVSTHLFVNQRLHTALFDRMLQAGADGFEIFCARQSFDYTRPGEMESLAAWFRHNPGRLHSLHAPMYSDDCWGRSGAPALNLAATDQRQALCALEETERALTFAELAPFRYMVLHLGIGGEEYSEAKAESACAQLERLRVKAKTLGVQLLVENIPNGLSTPSRLLQFLKQNHLDSLGICFDSGHAHLPADRFGGGGALETFELLAARVASTHLHDNHGEKDEHLWPGEGRLPFERLLPQLARRPDLPWLLEIHDAPATEATFDRLRQIIARMRQFQ